MTPEDELRQAIPGKGTWFHSIEIEPGVWTDGHKTRAQMEHELQVWGFPADLTGKTVLDIGCADGGWSLAALRRGARSVLAIDDQQTTGRRLLQAANTFPQIDFRTLDLFSDEFLRLPTFDFVIFTGVLYHVQDMVAALKRVRARISPGGEALMETHVNESAGSSPPLAVYYETDEFGADVTNWWGPNFACLEAMLRTADLGATRNSVQWQDAATRRNARVAYRLTPGAAPAAPAGDSLGDLHQAQAVIAQLTAENARLRSGLGGLARRALARIGRRP